MAEPAKTRACKDLPLDMLSKVAAGRKALRTMRRVSHTWQSGFELSVSSLTITKIGPLPPPGYTLAQRFSGLTSLDLGGCRIKAKWLRKLKAFTRLARLVLGATNPFGSDDPLALRLKDADLQYLQGMRISTLDLQGCSCLTDAGLDALRGLPLSSLNLDGCSKLTAVGLGALRGMPISRLSLCECPLVASRAAFNQLRGLPLAWLSMDSIDQWPEGVDDEIPESRLEALGMPLTHLSLSGQIWPADEDLKALRGLPLTSLDVTRSPEITDAGLESLVGMPLTFLGLYGNFVPDDGLRHLSEMPLTELDFGAAFEFSNEGMHHFLEMQSLVALSLSDNFWLTNEGLKVIRGLPLTRLRLDCCEGLTDAGLVSLVGLPLTALSLSSNDWLSDDGLEFLRGLPLKKLRLSACENVTDAGMDIRFELNLTCLSIDGCTGISDECQAKLDLVYNDCGPWG